MANIDDLKYNFDSGARANRYHVEFTLPKAFGKSGDAGRNMGLRVEACELPGRTIETKAWSEYGQTRLMPTGTVTGGGTTTMSFLCDQSFADRAILEAWNELVYATAENDFGTIEHPIFAYYDEYTGSVEINQLRSDSKAHTSKNDSKGVALTYTLHEAYPVSFEAQTLSNATPDILKFSVTFAYRNWSSKYNENHHTPSFLNKGRAILDTLLSGSNLLSRFGKEGKLRRKLTNLDNKVTRIKNIFGGG
jgi:hypothetical protein